MKNVLFWLILIFPLFGVAFSLFPLRKHAIQADGSLRLLVVGDWGRKGTYNQSKVAFQMGRIGSELGTNFVISTGDNFYDNGLIGVDDPAFLQSFSQIYTSHSLQKPWFSVLGNHDYRGNALAQLDPVLNHIDSRWICMKSFVLNAGVADFFMLDTTPFVTSYWVTPNKHTYDWRGVLPRGNYIRTLLKDLDSALRRSSAKWKIVVGHHAIRSVGHHGDTEELQLQLLPILESHQVDLYVNGHDHCLEHISRTRSSIQFFTSGAGSKSWRGMNTTADKDGLKFYYDGQGFLSLEFNVSMARAAFYDINGAEIHTWSQPKCFFHPLA